MKSVDVSQSVGVDASEPPAPVVYPVLNIPGGYGVNATIDDGRLVLTQAGLEDSTDQVVLTKSEAIALFAHFKAWVAA